MQEKTAGVLSPLDMEILGFGWEKADPTRVLQSFVREHYRIHYVTKGVGWLKTKEQDYRLTAGCGFVIFPGEATQISPSQSDPWEYFWLGVRGEDVAEWVRRASLSRAAPVFRWMGDEEEALKHVVCLYTAMLLPSAITQPAGYYLCALLENSTPFDGAKHSKSSYFEAALAYIHRNYQNNLTVCALASHLAIDRTYLYKIFKSNIHCSPQAYLINHRIAKACDLLLSTDRSTADIACSVGFNDLSDFSKQFKKRMGMSTKKFRALSDQKNNVKDGIYY